MARAAARRGIPARARRLAGAYDAAGASRGDRPEWKRGGGLITIIAGEFKNRRLKTPAGDKVRGSGALGLEALSRGAHTADFVEVHRHALAALRANLKSLKLEERAAINRVDALRFTEQLRSGQYDVAFADPPYASEKAKQLVAMFRIVPFARVFSIEHSADTPIPGDDTRRYGDTAVTFLYAP